jgi:hypothetical protein
MFAGNNEPGRFSEHHPEQSLRHLLSSEIISSETVPVKNARKRERNSTKRNPPIAFHVFLRQEAVNKIHIP